MSDVPATCKLCGRATLGTYYDFPLCDQCSDDMADYFLPEREKALEWIDNEGTRRGEAWDEFKLRAP